MILIAATFTANLLQVPLELFCSLLNDADEIRWAPYQQIFQYLLNPSSDFYRNHQGINILLIRFEDWLPQGDDFSTALDQLMRTVNEFSSALATGAHHCQVPFLVGVCHASPQALADTSLSNFFTQLETTLKTGLADVPNVILLTPQEIDDYYPVSPYYQGKTYQLGHIPYTQAYFYALAALLTRKRHALARSPYKVLVLDCDDTLWGGICGEVGPMGVILEASYLALQDFYRRQQQAGMLVCLCSKNNESDVWAVFDTRPEMQFRREHLTTWRINWQAKEENLLAMAETLQLDLASFIFIDDNPLEGARVRARYPEVLTLVLPPDPQERLHFLQHIWAFDQVKVTEEDRKRTLFYQHAQQREQFKRESLSLEAFLAGLELQIRFEELKPEHMARAVELTQRVNQFNCSGEHLTAQQLKQYLKQGSTGWVVNVRDRFGDYGWVGVLLFRIGSDSLQVSHFLLSCRVLGKGVEHHVLTALGHKAQTHHLPYLYIRFIPTAKNCPARHFLESLAPLQKNEGEEAFRWILASEVASQIRYLPTSEQQDLVSSTQHPVSSSRVRWNAMYLNIAQNYATVTQIAQQLQQLRQDRIMDLYKPPQTPLEKALVAIWEKVLKITPIGIEDHFLHLNGDSLQATLIAAEIAEVCSINIPPNEILNQPTITQLLETLAHNQNPLLPLSRLPETQRQTLFPLSFAQQRLWFLEQWEPNSPLYNMFIAYEITGILEITALKKAFASLIERHASLRTAFITQDHSPKQQIVPYSPDLLVFSTETVGDLTETALREYAHTEAQKPFNLTQAPLLSVHLLQCTPDRSILLWRLHHIINDGWSFNVLLKELSALYTAYQDKKAPTLTIPSIDYADFTCWQRHCLNKTRLAVLTRYWQKRLADLPPLELPLDYPRPPVHTYQGARLRFTVSKRHVQRIKQLAKTTETTLFTVLISAFSILISHYTSQKDISIGTAVSGRNHPDLQKVIGLFANILMIRTDLSHNPTFRELITTNQAMIQEAYNHQDLPFEKLVEILNPNRVYPYNPLSQVMFIFQQHPIYSLDFPNVTIRRVFSDNDTLLLADYDSAKVDLSFYLQEVDGRLQGLVEYNTDLFKKESVAYLIEHYLTLVYTVLDQPDHNIFQISWIPEPELDTVLKVWNSTEQPYPADQTLHGLFEEQAKQTPENPAVHFLDKTLTYQALNKQANQLARYLLRQGVKRESTVALVLEEGFNTLVSILAILKAGAAYLFIRTDFPKNRISLLLRHSQASVLVIDQVTESKLSNQMEWTGLTWVHLDRVQSAITQESSDNLTIACSPNNLAYLIYTSGSTGEPKGVLIEHRGVVNMAWAQRKQLSIYSNSRVLQWASLSFDASVWEIWGAWLSGACLYLIPKCHQLGGELLLNFMKKQLISIACLTPSVLETLPETELPALKTLVIAGEVCSKALAEKWGKHRCFINAYGPTETTVCASLYVVDTFDQSPSIGKPLANTKIYVLNEYQKPVPIGVPGELYISGTGLARGYLAQSGLTEQYFVSIFTQRAYRTGDRARWRPDGTLEYLGRMDPQQVKIRGVRIELGEIEQYLKKHPGIAQVLLLKKDQRLLAYLVPQASFLTQSEWVQHIRDERVKHWCILYDTYYQEFSAFPLSAERPVYFGWNSSYTGFPIPTHEMEEWLSYTAKRILSLQPKKVLEIGCGHGLMVSKIAHLCQHYTATDFSQPALDYVKRQFYNKLPCSFIVECSAADHFIEHHRATYDTVIINSVTQYFPDLSYLIHVLNNAVNYSQDGGKIFIGDVRSLTHLKAFYTMVVLEQSGKTAHLSDLELILQEKIQGEEELIIDPEFFSVFAHYHPRLSHATIQLRRGLHSNELTCFRYDVILHVKAFSVSPEALSLVWNPWGKSFQDLQAVEKTLYLTAPGILAVQSISNGRLDRALAILDTPTMGSHLFLSEITEENHLQASCSPEYDPEHWAALGERLGYQVLILWSKEDQLRCFDVLFYKGIEYPRLELPSRLEIAVLEDPKRWTNDPIKAQSLQSLLREVKTRLKNYFPEFMLPSSYFFIEELPLTVSGKIDYQALAASDKWIGKKMLHTPRNTLQKQLLKVWQNTLQRDSIGVKDDFFEIGGHSLLAVQLISQINRVFQVTLPLRSIFEAPTIQQLGVLIEQSRIGICVHPSSQDGLVS